MEQAAFASIGSIALNGVHLAKLTQGERVVVIGLGLIGKLTCGILRSYGHQVLGIDPVALQREKTARWLGIQTASPQEAPVVKEQLTDGLGFDAAIITAATSSNDPLELAADLVRLKARVVAVGNVGLKIPRRKFFEKEIDFTVPHSGGPGLLNPWHREFGLDYPLPFVRWTQGRNLAEFLRLVAEENLNLEPLINKKILFEKALSAYEMLEQTKTPLDGLILKYPTAVKKAPEIITLIHKEKTLKAPLKDQIGIGIIGVGNFGQGTLLPILKKLKNARLMATSAKTGAAAVQAGKRFGADYATTRPEKIIEDPKIDLIIIATRHDLHTPLAIKALEAGKSVHVEKPPALNKKELEALIKAAQKSEGQLFVGYNRRYSKPVQKIKDFLGADPKIIHLRYQAGPVPSDHWVYHPEQGGGRIIGEMGHFIDLASFLTGSLPVEVSAWQLPGGQHPSDQLLTIIKFKGGSILQIEFLTSPRYRFPAEHLAVFSAKKAAFLNDFSHLELHGPLGSKSSKRFPDKGHSRMLEAEINALKTGKPELIPLKTLQATSITTFAVEQALREGRSLKLEFGN
jgi:predicted dehydrogenase